MDTTEIYLHKKASQFIMGLIDFLKLDSVYLIGASSGASIALCLSTLRADLVKRAIVIGQKRLDFFVNSLLWIVPHGGHFCFPPYLDAKYESHFVK
jgi:pimeloyl-ACP methyl ester carboxylesterase